MPHRKQTTLQSLSFWNSSTHRRRLSMSVFICPRLTGKNVYRPHTSPLRHPLRSTSIADASTLLPDDPPSPSASIFPFSWFALIGFLLASLGDFPGSAYPPHGKLRPPLMPDAAPPVNRFRQSLSRSSHHAAVLTSSHRFRHFNGGFLAVLFLPDT
jgi:hypothetical protein